MRDPGLSEAIQAVGGVSELARRIGISQPSVSNWDKVPAERVLAVEAATGVERMRLRPDLYRETTAIDVDDIDLARAQEYTLLSALLARAPDAQLLQRLARLGGDASPLGLAHVALGEAAARVAVGAIEREYFNLFIGLGRGDLLPYGSYYLTGFLNERPLARLRDDLAAFGVERVDGNYEPEDHAATLCEIMAAFAGGRFTAPQGAERKLFEKHMAPWIGRFFADLERAEAAEFYRHVGALGRVFIEIETEAFALPG
jgi:TorA maturation chaperone TorD